MRTWTVPAQYVDASAVLVQKRGASCRTCGQGPYVWECGAFAVCERARLMCCEFAPYAEGSRPTATLPRHDVGASSPLARKRRRERVPTPRDPRPLRTLSLGLTGYADRLSVSGGESIAFKVSAEADSGTWRLVALVDGPHAGPASAQALAVPGFRPARIPLDEQPLTTGSSASARVDVDAPERLSVSVWLQVTRMPEAGRACVWCLAHERAAGLGLALLLSPTGRLQLLTLDGCVSGQVETPIRRRRWILITVAPCGPGQWELRTFDATDGTVARVEAKCDAWRSPDGGLERGRLRFSLAGGSQCAARLDAPRCLNAKLARPTIWRRPLSQAQLAALQLGAYDPTSDNSRLASWDLGAAPATRQASSLCHGGLPLELVGAPTRAVTGPTWSGVTLDHRSDPSQYDAVHFHEDDLEDAGWTTTLDLDVPVEMQSGVYAVEIRAGELVDYLPFIVAPRPGRAAARVAVLLPTLTYLAYANRRHEDPMLLAALPFKKRNAVDGSIDHRIMRNPQLGLSLYDKHLDGSQVVYSSYLRPVLEFRPTYINGFLGVARHFSADLHLIGWLRRAGVPVDVLTDHDLLMGPRDQLEPYRVALTGSHPEYYTRGMLDKVARYLQQGGRLMYMGGNGMHGSAAVSRARPHLMEVRRVRGAAQFGRVESGESHHSQDGEPGGPWRFRGRPPQRILGVGTTAWGIGPGSAFNLVTGIRATESGWIVNGVDGDTIGRGGSFGGAAGDELDRADHEPENPGATRIVASSRGLHGDGYEVLAEDKPQAGPEPPPADNPLIRADMALTTLPSGGGVFSASSIGWILGLALPDISRITRNVLDRFLEDQALSRVCVTADASEQGSPEADPDHAQGQGARPEAGR